MIMLTGQQLRAARAVLKWRASDLADKAGVHLATIQRGEKADGPVPLIPTIERAVREVLEQAGIEFLPAEGNASGLRWKNPVI